MITASLASGRNRTEYDIAISYLTHLAYRMFKNGTRVLDRDQLAKVDDDYERRFDIRLPGEDIRQRLIGQRVMDERGGEYRFKYPFLYYYFVARYWRAPPKRVQEL